MNEEGVDEYGKVLVSVSEKYFRPVKASTLLGDASKAKKVSLAACLCQWF